MKRVRVTENEAPVRSKGNPNWRKGMKKPPNSGRAKGVPNKVTMLLKEAIPQAIENLGADGKGKDGLIGWLMNVAKKEPVAFLRLVDRLLPYQITGAGGGPVQMTYEKKEDIAQRMKERGMPIPKSLMDAPAASEARN